MTLASNPFTNSPFTSRQNWTGRNRVAVHWQPVKRRRRA
jgi:hypothetical protein